MPHRTRHKAGWRNWSGSVECEPRHVSHPHSVEEVQAEVLRVAEEGERLRVVGGGGSFSPLCWSDENHMALDQFAGLESVDAERRRVWVRAGTPMRALGALLAAEGLALESFGDIAMQTLAGAISTGTHGSGRAFGSLCTQVTGLRLVTVDGAVRTLSAASDAALFDAARLSLGALGVITHVELQCVDAYRLHRHRARATLAETLARLPEHLEAHRHFEFFWFPLAGSVRLEFAEPTTTPASRLALRAAAKDYLLENAALLALSEAVRRVPRVSERAARFSAWAMPTGGIVREAHRAWVTPRLVRFNEIEYAVPLAQLPQILAQIERVLRALRYAVHFPLHVRFVRGDDVWLSPGYQRDCAYIAAHVYHAMPHEDYFGALAEIFDRADGRPHWGKLHDKDAHALHALYPRFGAFCQLRQSLDPRGVLVNPHLAQLFGLEAR